MSRAWSSGSLAVGSRHMIQVKQEGRKNQKEIQAEIQAWFFFFSIHGHVSSALDIFNLWINFICMSMTCPTILCIGRHWRNNFDSKRQKENQTRYHVSDSCHSDRSSS